MTITYSPPDPPLQSLTVACPWCFAGVGEHCVNNVRASQKTHLVRTLTFLHGNEPAAVDRIARIIADNEARQKRNPK